LPKTTILISLNFPPIYEDDIKKLLRRVGRLISTEYVNAVFLYVLKPVLKSCGRDLSELCFF